MMRKKMSSWFLGSLVFLLAGCQASQDSATPTSESRPAPTTDPAAMQLVVMTEVYDSSGETQDQKIETSEATRDGIVERFKALDWEHPTNRYHLALSGGGLNSPDRRKLSITEELPEGSDQTILAAKLEETPSGESELKYYTCQQLESPDVALQLLLSFLAQDGEYRTMVEWREP